MQLLMTRSLSCKRPMRFLISKTDYWLYLLSILVGSALGFFGIGFSGNPVTHAPLVLSGKAPGLYSASEKTLAKSVLVLPSHTDTEDRNGDSE